MKRQSGPFSELYRCPVWLILRCQIKTFVQKHEGKTSVAALWQLGPHDLRLLAEETQCHRSTLQLLRRLHEEAFTVVCVSTLHQCVINFPHHDNADISTVIPCTALDSRAAKPSRSDPEPCQKSHEDVSCVCACVCLVRNFFFATWLSKGMTTEKPKFGAQ